MKNNRLVTLKEHDRREPNSNKSPNNRIGLQQKQKKHTKQMKSYDTNSVYLTHSISMPYNKTAQLENKTTLLINTILIHNI